MNNVPDIRIDVFDRERFLACCGTAPGNAGDRTFMDCVQHLCGYYGSGTRLTLSPDRAAASMAFEVHNDKVPGSRAMYGVVMYDAAGRKWGVHT